MQVDALFRDVASRVTDMCVHPETQVPYPLSTIERAMRESLHFAPDTKKAATAQALQVVKQLEASERALSDELVRQTQLMDEAGDPRQLRAELQELEGRHIDALELMGETSEENEELKDRVQGLRMEVDRLTEQLAAAMA